MAGWSGEDCGQNRLDMMFPSGRYGYRNVSGDRLLLLCCLPEPPGVEHGTYGLKIGNRNMGTAITRL